jgi:GDP-4-dehydro-6-deoxy-D-mannose reductase
LEDPSLVQDDILFMAQKILITGISGFAGNHLAHALSSSSDVSIAGTYLSEKDLGALSDIKSSLTLEQVNLLENEAVSKLISSYKPDVVYHLAALTSAAESFKNPVGTFSNNVSAQLNVLNAIKEAQLNTKILIVSSAEVYGAVSTDHIPTSEDTPFRPTNPYAVSKVAQDLFGLQYFLSYKLPIIRVRPFNHIGPYQSPQFAIASFAKKIAEIEKKKIDPVLTVGNLQTKRDFTDVRDIVKAYILAIEKGVVGEVYNIGSDVSYSMEEILQKLLSLSSVKIEIKQDTALLRPNDTPQLLCNSTKFRTLTGWKPEIDLTTTLTDTVNYWRNMVQ